MKFLINQLNEYIKIDNLSKDELSDIFTKLAYEVEEIYPAAVIDDNVQFKLVEDCVKHPNADTLNFLHTSINGKLVDVVCGAPNIKKGQIVAHAVPGSKVGELKMQPKDLRGIVSNGMIVSMQEILGLGSKIIEDEAQHEIVVFPENTDLNSNVKDVLGLQGNVYDLSILPDRQYASSYYAMAHEIAAFLGKDIEINFDAVNRALDNNNSFELKEEANAIYTTNVELNLENKTPMWIKKVLYHSGIKPENNINDLTRYIMLLTGANTYVLAQDSKFTLEGRKLHSEKDNLEIDIFNDKTHNNEAKNISLVTIASNSKSNFVNEKNINDIHGARSIKGTSSLSAKISSEAIISLGVKSGFIVQASKTTGLGNFDQKTFEISDEYIFNYIGKKINLNEIEPKLNLIGIMKEGDKYIIPSYRNDIEFKADVIEEIVRFYGVENIEPLPYKVTDDQVNPEFHKKALVSIVDELTKYGFNETKSYDLVPSKVANKYNIWNINKLIELTDEYSLEQNTLQTSLISGLIESFKINHRNDKKDIRLFELGNVFHNEKSIYSLGILHDEHININDPILATKELVLKSLESLGLNEKDIEFINGKNDIFNPYINSEIKYRNEIIGLIGEIHPSILRENKFIRLDKVKAKLYYAEVKLEGISNE